MHCISSRVSRKQLDNCPVPRKKTTVDTPQFQEEATEGTPPLTELSGTAKHRQNFGGTMELTRTEVKEDIQFFNNRLSAARAKLKMLSTTEKQRRKLQNEIAHIEKLIAIAEEAL